MILSPVILCGAVFQPQQPAAIDKSVLLKFGGVELQGVRVFVDGTKFGVLKAIWCERLDFDTDLQLYARCGGQMRQDLVGKSFEVESFVERLRDRIEVGVEVGVCLSPRPCGVLRFS